MKKVIIIGANGSLARYVIEALKTDKDVTLTLFLRDKRKLPESNLDNFMVIEGDAMNFNSVRNAIAGHDIVYVNLAGNLEIMTSNIVRAMQETGVKRIIAISSIGIYEKPLRQVLISYRRLADIIETSDLEYTILRPDWFTDENEINYALTLKGEPEEGTAVSRRSIAAFISSIVQNPLLHINENLGISKPIK